MSDIHRKLLLGATLLGLTGCLAPKYVRPPVESGSNFKEASDTAWITAQPAELLPRGKWWELFGDPRLDQLEDKAAAANQSIKQAEAQYREAHAIVVTARASFFPTVGVAANATRSYGSSTASANRSVSNNFSVPLTASWEPDLWGQTRYSYENAAYSSQSSAALLENVRLSIQAEVASDYFQLEELDMEGTILSSATASYEENLNLTLTRFKDGVASQVDVTQAQSQLDSTKAQTSDVALSRAQLEHAIAVLLGQSPASFSLDTGSITGLPPVVPAGLPAQLLERRPDIASAERLVAAANANIGLQRAAYFPLISLTAGGGYSNNALVNLLMWPSRFWAIGASAAETLIDFGKRSGLNQQARAQYDQQVANYRQTVLGGFQEVEDNLAALDWLAKEAVDQDAAVKAAVDSLRLEVERYKAGVVSFIDVITSENIALTAQRSAAQVLGRRMVADVTLVRALGGGWDDSKLPKN